MLIGITGPAGSGKTTAANYLVKNHGFIHLKFAGSLKAMVRTLLVDMGVSVEHQMEMIEGDEKENTQGWLNGKTPRHAMQTLGTEWGRKCMGEDFWVNVAQQRVMSEHEQCSSITVPRILFDDVRFENEAAMIRNMGGTIVHMTGRGGIEGSHASEGGVARINDDCGLANNGGIDDVYHAMNQILNWITDE